MIRSRSMKILWQHLPERKSCVVKILWSVFAMIFVSFGIYLQLKADIGLSPWNALNQGLSNVLPISYGAASIVVSFAVLFIDVIMKEPVGVGTILDSVLIGLATDFFVWLDPVPEAGSLALKIVIFLLGLAVLCFGQFFYMDAGLGCGSRDALMLALGKKFNKISVGTINNIIFLVVLIASCFLGATIGLGTVISVFCNGIMMDAVFKLVKFKPLDVQHQSLAATVRSLFAPGTTYEFD